MTEKKLREFKEFINCYDIIDRAYELCGGRDYCYLRKDGVGTYNIDECIEMIEKKDGTETIDGYTTIEVHHICGYTDIIHIPIIIYLEDWDKEEKIYNCESYTINNCIEEWY